MFDLSSIYVIPLSVIVIISLGNALLGRWLAVQKGRDASTWFCLCLFFGIFALLVLGFAPQKIIKKNYSSMSATLKCPKCNIENMSYRETCKECGHRLG